MARKTSKSKSSEDQSETAETRTTRYLLLKSSEAQSYIIGEFLGESENAITMYHPIIIRLIPSSEHELSIYVTELLPFSDDKIITFLKSSLLCFAKPSVRLIEYYIKTLDNAKKNRLDELMERNFLMSAQDEDPDRPLDLEDMDPPSDAIN